MYQDYSPYISYILRLWLENNQGHEDTARTQSEWRASLEDPHTQKMKVFPSLDALFDFLLRETERLASGEDTRLEAEDVT